MNQWSAVLNLSNWPCLWFRSSVWLWIQGTTRDGFVPHCSRCSSSCLNHWFCIIWLLFQVFRFQFFNGFFSYFVWLFYRRKKRWDSSSDVCIRIWVNGSDRLKTGPENLIFFTRFPATAIWTGNFVTDKMHYKWQSANYLQMSDSDLNLWEFET